MSDALNTITLVIPDLGDSQDAIVIEVAVKPGDTIAVDDTLLTLEGEKATMDVPAEQAGVVQSVLMSKGDTVNTGDVMVTLQVAADAAPTEAATTPSAEPQICDLAIPDIGDTEAATVIDVVMSVGDTVTVDQTLLTLEGEKATMDVPSPYAGVIKAVSVNKGDEVSSHSVVGQIETVLVVESTASSSAIPAPAGLQTDAGLDTSHMQQVGGLYASPTVRRLAREFGVDLSKIKGTERKGRITKADLQRHVRRELEKAASGGGPGVAAAPKVDFSRFGETTLQPLNKIKRYTSRNLHRNWVTVPHVTQFDRANITALEAYRGQYKGQAKTLDIRLTPLVFIMKALVDSLKAFPTFNASLDENGENLVLKQYYNVGIAVDTPDGLVVPVIRDVDQKDVIELSQELVAISTKARDEGLAPLEMQGGTMTISSLGGIGGEYFTPIVNAPEVAILGVSKASQTPQWVDGEWQAALELPLSLSYDHRVIDGAEAARFMVHLCERLSSGMTDCDIEAALAKAKKN